MKKILIRFSGMVIMLVLLIVGLGGCTADPEDNAVDSSDDIEIVGDAETADTYKYAVVYNEEGDYIIGKTADGSWQEILKSENSMSLIGFYDNKLYFCDPLGLAYVDFNGTDFSRISWIDAPEPDPDAVLFSTGVLVKDIMYFNFNTFGGGDGRTDGILTLKLSDTSLDDAIQLIPQAQFNWQIDRTNKTIYYLKAPYSNGNSLCAFDLTTNRETVLFENVGSFALYDSGKILFSKKEADITVAELYLYDIKTGENQLIFDNLYSYSGGLWSCADYRNGDVYYADNDQIIKYNNGNRDVVYTYSPSDGGDYFYGFEFLKDDIIELVLQNTPNKYLINGEVVADLPDNEKVSVGMNDGTTAFFDRLNSPV